MYTGKTSFNADSLVQLSKREDDDARNRRKNNINMDRMCRCATYCDGGGGGGDFSSFVGAMDGAAGRKCGCWWWWW